MVVFDTSILLLVLDPHARPPLAPTTGAPVERAADRIQHLIDTLNDGADKILVPTPVLSELLVYAGRATQGYLQFFNERAVFRIAPFDTKAAIEAAVAHRDALDRGGIRVDAATPDASRTKIKFDRQIVAIAKAEGARTVYSDDEDVIAYAIPADLGAHRTIDLDLPPEDPQHEMGF